MARSRYAWLAGPSGVQIDFQENPDRLRAAAAGANGLESVSVSGHDLPVAGVRVVAQAQSGPGIEGARLPRARQIIHHRQPRPWD
jgi:hypothetical protein